LVKGCQYSYNNIKNMHKELLKGKNYDF